jgi:hypothetical protein
MGPAGVAIVERQWLWIVHQRARLVCLLMALALRGAA